jgi:hypothetical protein
VSFHSNVDSSYRTESTRRRPEWSTPKPVVHKGVRIRTRKIVFVHPYIYTLYTFGPCHKWACRFPLPMWDRAALRRFRLSPRSDGSVGDWIYHLLQFPSESDIPNRKGLPPQTKSEGPSTTSPQVLSSSLPRPLSRAPSHPMRVEPRIQGSPALNSIEYVIQGPPALLTRR